MPRPIWSGAINFGLVNIPVKLYNTVSKKTLHFHQLRKDDGCRVRLKKICPADGAEVTADQIVKGYEISPDRYVTISSDELDSLNPKASRSIDIQDFVQFGQVDPLYIEQSYYMLPDKGAAKAYALLLAALKKTGKAGIAKLVLRNKQHLTALRPITGAIVLSTMHFANEVISLEQLEDLPQPEIEPTERELSMAEQIIESLAADFDITKYTDEYRSQVLELIERKAEGETIAVQPENREPGKVVDLMAALEASLAAMKNKKSPGRKPPTATGRRKQARG